MLCYWCETILHILAYETWHLVLELKWQMNEVYSFKTYQFTFLTEYSGGTLYGNVLGEISLRHFNSYIQWGDFLLFYLYVFCIMDPSFDRSQTNHFVMETNTIIPQHLWPNAWIVPEIRSYLTSIFFVVLLYPVIQTIWHYNLSCQQHS